MNIIDKAYTEDTELNIIYIRYSIQICKYIKNCANKNRKISFFVGYDEQYKENLINIIINHNNLLVKFVDLYNKFMDLIIYIKSTLPKILDKADVNKYNIENIRENCKDKLEIEQFDINIIEYLTSDEIKLLKRYIDCRDKDLHNKILRLINLIEKLETTTLNFEKNVKNLIKF